VFLSKSRSTPNYSTLLYNPWLYFAIFTITNTVLAYSSFNLEINLYIALIGWAFPMVLGLVYFSKANIENDFFHEETLPVIPFGWWLWAAILAIIPRLYLLLNSTWFVPDEGIFGYAALELSQKWNWHFFFTPAQVPPMAFWFGAIYSKLFTPSIFSMRLFSFLLSILTILLGYWCGRHFFSKSIMFLCFIFVAFSFAPLYISKFFDFQQFLVVFEITTLGLLGSFFNSKNSKNLAVNSWLLGIATGLGFCVAIQWPLVAFMILLAVIYKLGKKTLTCYRFSIPILLFFTCFCYFSFAEKNGNHIKMLLSSPINGNILKRLNDSFANWTALFWGCDTQNSYGPVWGGMLNPISGSLFFIGIFELIRHKRTHLARWVLVSFFVFMIPGLITNYFEIFRNAMIFPLLLLICALGTLPLLKSINLNWRGLFIIAICLFAAPLDFIHLLKSQKFSPDQTYRQAFDALNQIQKQSGPGVILLDFQPVSCQTLSVATYPFNAAQNPNLDPKNSRWLAFIENVHYKPFLTQAFPKLTTVDLGLDGYWNQGNLTLFIIPIDSQFYPTSQKWLQIDRSFHSIASDSFFDPLDTSLPVIFKNLSSMEVLMKEDRFLESIYCEKIIFFHTNHMNSSQMLFYLTEGLKNGYPLPHLLVTQGLLLSYTGRNRESIAALQKAIDSRLNQTDANNILQDLKKFKKIPLKKINGKEF
jgi:4-amino-4-deoxy-L-arabinose transferase-like glycosyltransferase